MAQRMKYAAKVVDWSENLSFFVVSSSPDICGKRGNVARQHTSRVTCSAMMGPNSLKANRKNFQLFTKMALTRSVSHWTESPSAITANPAQLDVVLEDRRKCE